MSEYVTRAEWQELLQLTKLLVEKSLKIERNMGAMANSILEISSSAPSDRSGAHPEMDEISHMMGMSDLNVELMAKADLLFEVVAFLLAYVQKTTRGAGDVVTSALDGPRGFAELQSKVDPGSDATAAAATAIEEFAGKARAYAARVRG